LLNINMSYCYKELDLENFESIQSQLVPYIVNEYPDRQNFYNVVIQENLYHAVPDFKQVLESLFGGTPNRIFLMVIPYSSDINTIKKFTDEHSLHQDTAVFPYRVNWPILNNRSVEVKFFTTDKEPVMSLMPSGKTDRRYNFNDCKEIDSLVLTKPTIFNTSIIHGLFLKSHQLPRYILSLEYQYDLSSRFP
jgi:hypothetical protein